MHQLLTIALSAQLGAALPPDSIDTLHDRARRAEARFERLARQLAPVTWSSGAGYDCDEIVGRFCLHFDSTSSAPPESREAGRIIDALREAVEAVRRYFSAAPGELDAAGPLVRMLVRDGRFSEAVSGAGAFAALSADTLWGDLLLGFALHWEGSDQESERHFVAALARMTPEERQEWLDTSWLLDPSERGRVNELPPDQRIDYDRRFWLLADPFWATPANERWNEHVSRHIEARLLAEVPRVGGMVRWGEDLDQLTVRYGTPTSRARIAANRPMQETGMVEYWDSAQRVFAPPRDLDALPDPPAPGERAALYAAAARSSYAMQRFERVVELDHQATRFLRGDSVVIRVDAEVPLAGVRTADASLITFDSAFTHRSGVEGRARIERDTARFGLVVPVTQGRIVYSAELLADSVLGARARYALDTRIPARGIVLSDILIAHAFDEHVVPERFDDAGMRPRASLVLASGDTLGVYAEVYRTGGATFDIEVALERAGGPSLFRRFGRWLGLLDEGEAPRVRWQATATAETHVIAINLPLEEERDGMHDLVLRVTSRATGERAETRRRILIQATELRVSVRMPGGGGA